MDDFTLKSFQVTSSPAAVVAGFRKQMIFWAEIWEISTNPDMWLDEITDITDMTLLYKTLRFIETISDVWLSVIILHEKLI